MTPIIHLCSILAAIVGIFIPGTLPLVQDSVHRPMEKIVQEMTIFSAVLFFPGNMKANNLKSKMFSLGSSE